MNAPDFSTSITVDRSPEDVFAAINRPEVWWNELIEGNARAVGDEFGFDLPGVHRTRMRVTEADPGRRVVWHVLENHFAFVDDQDEWLGTDVAFDIEPGDGGTTVTVTHVGLVPQFECYEVCSGAWTHHLNAGLRAMLSTGDPEPMTAEKAAEVAHEFATARAREAGGFSTSFIVENTPDEVYAAINNPRAWWATDITEIQGSEDGRIEGSTDRAGADFVFEVPGVHYSKIRVAELVPGERVVWRVVDATISFVEDTDEWTGTEIRFEITPTDSGTEVRFTHDGLVPAAECYDACSTAWGLYIGGSLRNLITTGTGNPGSNPDEASYQEAAGTR